MTFDIYKLQINTDGDMPFFHPSVHSAVATNWEYFVFNCCEKDDSDKWGVPQQRMWERCHRHDKTEYLSVKHGIYTGMLSDYANSHGGSNVLENNTTRSYLPKSTPR